jgi:ABC-type Na+ efflux pump permease subunit
MPANAKYLTTSPWQRFAKISAGILGGYLLSMSIHLALASWVHHVNVIITMTFTGFIVWVVFMILAFLAKSGWKIWGLYLFLALAFAVIAYAGKIYNPYFLH